MLRFQSDALKPGEAVFVHDDNDPELARAPGSVVRVTSRNGAADELAIRIAGSTSLVRPRRQAVHMAPPDRRFECWRCDATAALAA